MALPRRSTFEGRCSRWTSTRSANSAVNRSAISSSWARTSTSDRLNTDTSEPNAEKTCPSSTAMNPPPMMPRRRGSSSSRMIESEVWNPVSTRPGIGGDDRTRPGGDEDVGGAQSASLHVDLVRADEASRALDEGRVGRPRLAVLPAALGDRIDAAEHAVADGGPVGAVDADVDPHPGAVAGVDDHVRRPDEHLGRDAPHVEARPPERAALDDRDAAVGQVLGDRVPRSRSDDDQIELLGLAVLDGHVQVNVAAPRFLPSPSDRRGRPRQAPAVTVVPPRRAVARPSSRARR